MDKLPPTGVYTTYSVAKGNPKLPDYVTDSAESGTDWATGVKTYNGAISVNAYGKPVATVLEQAKAAGYRTGNVTTAELQDATPAVLGAHVVSRDCKGPDAMATCPQNDLVNGGAGSISDVNRSYHTKDPPRPGGCASLRVRGVHFGISKTLNGYRGISCCNLPPLVNS